MFVGMVGLFLVLFLLGFVVVNADDAFGARDANTLALNCLASLALGIGLCSATYFWGWVLFGRPGLFWVLEALLLVAVLCASARLRAMAKRLRVPGAWSLRFDPGFSLRSVFLAVVVFFLGGLASNLYARGLSLPHGQWDAWAIWNAHARFLAESEVFGSMFSEIYSWSHPDYPLLLPASVARAWSFLGEATQFVPILFSVAFTIMTVAVLYCGIASLVSPIWGVVGASVLVSFSPFLTQGIAQYADIPLGLYFLLTLVLYATFDLQREKRSHLATIAAMSLSMAAWCKNEGILFVLVILSARGLRHLLLRNWAEAKNEVVATLWGVLPVGLTLAFFKMVYAPQSDLLSGAPATLLEKLIDLSRYELIYQSAVQRYQGVGVAVLALMLALMVLSLFRKRRSHQRHLATLTPVVMLLLMHAGYFFVYVTTPNDLQWHIGTSMTRLIVQLWPSLVFTFALLVPASIGPTLPEPPGGEVA